jgi:crotonobetainyl-CoA:carnitine CoA-transferase CaiB-like acyl-CoA transferase
VTPLSGVRVVSLATTYPGPLAGMMLSDLGAEVVVVENPKAPDTARRLPAFYAALNRGKRSVALDLKDPGGKGAFGRMVYRADVVMESFRPGVAARLGVDHEALRATNPRLIYVSISGYGQDGPMATVPAHDVNLQAESGLLAATGRSGLGSDFAEAPAVEFADLMTGMTAVQAVLLALFGRERTGRGTHVDVSMLDSLVSVLATHIVPTVNHSGPPGAQYEAGYGLFPTADGQLLALGIAGEDHFWQALCDVLDLPDLRDLSAHQRLQSPGAARQTLVEAISRRPLDLCLKQMRAQGIPASPILPLGAVAGHVQVLARHLLHPVGQTDGDQASYVRQPLIVDGCGPGPTRPAPELGADTVEVLLRSGMTPAEVENMLTRGAAFDGARPEPLSDVPYAGNG